MAKVRLGQHLSQISRSPQNLPFSPIIYSLYCCDLSVLSTPSHAYLNPLAYKNTFTNSKTRWVNGKSNQMDRKRKPFNLNTAKPQKRTDKTRSTSTWHSGKPIHKNYLIHPTNSTKVRDRGKLLWHHEMRPKNLNLQINKTFNHIHTHHHDIPPS